MPTTWWQSLLYAIGSAVAGAVLNWLMRQGPPAPPSATLSQSGGGA